jgi:TolB-like protein/tRNA A-37 threonylcarbamoyl transferase component Bud32
MIDDALRTALADRYRIEREIGAGGMATVYLAEDLKHRRKVALKVLRPELSAQLGPERFLHEIALTASLQNPHIVPLFDSGAIDGQLFYVMPYVEGETLRARMARGPVPLDESLDLLRDIARALAYAHSRGVVHRDIKPDNVLLSSGTAVVTDFGIAKALSASHDMESDAANIALTRAGTSLGTPAYMSPEQALGDTVDERTDIYAWGIIAYELLAGAHPFTLHATSQKLIAAQISETPVWIATKNPAVPLETATLVMRCLAKDPAERPANGGELLSQLSVAPPVPPLLRRRRQILAVAAICVAASSASTFMLLHRRAHSTSARSVVVVPFDNLGNPADAYFAEGMSDEIAGQLARIPGLQVIGREGVQRFRGSQTSPRDIARELGAPYVLSGTVRWAHPTTSTGDVDGDTRVRIVPTLLNVASGTQEWGEPYDERLTDVFKVQTSVAERVASALSVTLGGATRAALNHKESANPDARDAQLLGRYLLKQRGTANLRRAMAAFQNAISHDSSYARAWAGLSEAAALLPSYYDTTEPDSVLLARAEFAARRAVALDSTLPEVQLARARASEERFYFRDALSSVNKAIALDSNATLAYALKYEILTALGRTAEADSAARRAVELDAFTGIVLNNRALSLAAMGNLDSAIRYSQRSVEVAPSEPSWKRTLAGLYGLAGRHSDAVASCYAAGMQPKKCDDMYAAVTGTPEGRAATIALFNSMPTRTEFASPPAWSALQYAQLGMADSMFARLSAAIATHDDVFMHVITMPAFARYQSDPRWDAIVGEVRRR